MTAVAETPPRPVALAVEPDGIPAELRALDHWLVWRYEFVPRAVKPWTKVPYRAAAPDRHASSTDRATWGTFARAMAAYRAGRADGIGVALRPDDDVGALDLDDCRDAETGTLAPWAQRIVDQFASYTEVSPSGAGLRIFFHGRKPGPKCKRRRADGGVLEVYDGARGRYLTTTGRRLDGTPTTLEPRQAALDALYAEVFPPEAAPPAPRVPGGAPSLDDAALLRRAEAAANGEKFRRLRAGDTSGYASASEADLAFANLVGFWTGPDPARVERLMRASALVREKWDEPRGGSTYLQQTIATALAGLTEVYTASRNGQGGPPADGPPAAETDRPERGALPTLIVNDRPLRDVTADALRALVAANAPPTVYVRGGQLTRERLDERGRPILEPMSAAALRGRIARTADCERATSKGPVAVAPPKDLVEDLLALPAWPGLPALEALVEIPTVRPDGTILETPGYDAETRLLYRPAAGLVVPPVPAAPTRRDLDAALRLLAEAVGEFPYVDAASRTNLLALLLTLVARPAIEGPAPLAILDKPQAGTGASLLAEVGAVLGTGRPAGMMTAPTDEAEWRKLILAVLLTGATLVTIDNLESLLASPALAAAVTSVEFEDRVLGRSEMVRIPQRATWLVTGNNVRLGGDLPRRCYWVRLDAQTARPWLRQGFRHPDLLAWVQLRRGALLAALLTLCRAWWAAGCPAGDAKPLGGFEAWTRTIGGILAHAGCAGFLGNLSDMYERTDEETPAWEAFLRAWRETFGEQAVRVADVAATLREAPQGPLRAALPDDLVDVAGEPGRFQKRLGKALAKRVERRYGDEGLRVERAGDDTHGKVGRWRVRT